MKWSLAAGLALAPLALSACQTPVAPVEVTRFHLAVPPQGAGISIAAAPEVDAGIEFRNYATAVERELGRVGYRPERGTAPTDYRALVSYRTRFDRPGRRGSPVSVGMGGSTGSYGSGLGLGIGIDLSGPPKGVVYTELSVRIFNVKDQSAVWEGRALGQAREDTPAAQPGLMADKLAAALFRDYPGRSGETITVK